MVDIILHHYETSPYSEKIRLAFGIKGLAWSSVEIPRIMPKPDLMPLTGGYRKTPVMQIGADVYCDTQLILREIDARHPSPSLNPHPGVADALAWWAEKAMFTPAVIVAFAKIGDQLTSPPTIASGSSSATSARPRRRSVGSPVCWPGPSAWPPSAMASAPR